MKTRQCFDSKCHDLAVYFTEDAPVGRWRSEDVNELALLIQQTIEDFLADGPEETA
jgi:hypothetical protein